MLLNLQIYFQPFRHHRRQFNVKKTMKIDLIKTIITIAVSGLIAYGFFAFSTSINKDLLTYGSFFFLMITLMMTIGVNFKLPRTTTMVRTISAIFFSIALISNIFFSFMPFKEATYIIVNGILFLIYGLISYSIGKAKQ